MAQLWGGRFTKETDQLVYRFNASIGFDQKFYRQDIQGSMARPESTACTGRTTAAASFPGERRRKEKNGLLPERNRRRKSYGTALGRKIHQGDRPAGLQF